VRLDEKLEEMRFDSRLERINLNFGVITEADLKRHLTELPDDASRAEAVTLEETNDGI